MNVRLLALTAVAACALALPLAVASAGPAGDEGRPAVRSDAQDPAHGSPYTSSSGVPGRDLDKDEKSSSTGHGNAGTGTARPRPGASGGTSAPLLLGLGLETATRCGPELSSPDGVEAQTCVMTQGADTGARTYYRNATGEALDSVLSLMGPGGHTMQINCAADVDDEPATCETPRERTRGDLDAYTAVAEFAAHGGRGRLLLRSGSNSRTNDRN
jgi:hypothetical protein